MLEYRHVSLNGNGDGLLRNGSFQCALRVTNICVSSHIAGSKDQRRWLHRPTLPICKALVLRALALVNKSGFVAYRAGHLFATAKDARLTGLPRALVALHGPA